MIARRLVLGGGSALPFGAGAQTPRPPGRIGYLHPRTGRSDSVTLTVLRPVWQRLGYVEGNTLLVRSAEDDLARIPALAAELVRLGAGVLIVVGAAPVRAARQSVPETPIVAIDLETDPLRAGLAASFSRPGGTVTGLFLDQPSLAAKWIELLREADPAIERVAIVRDPSTPRDQLDVALDAARAKRIEAVVLELYAAAGFEPAFGGLTGGRRTGVVQLGSPGFAVVADAFAAAARKHGLPTISFLRAYAIAGALLTYGPNQEAYFPRAVILADRILRGEKPGDIPIERPDRFELAINLQTAKLLGLQLPSSLLAQADEVIE